MIYGWGTNDLDIPTTKAYRDTDGRCVQYWVDPVYQDWKNMVCRVKGCYKSSKMYKDASICEEWKYFSNFREWVLNKQPNPFWQNCVLDKDLLGSGQKIYSPETCVYVSTTLNCFITSQQNRRGAYMIGVDFQPKNLLNKFTARCRNPFHRKVCIHLGSFFTELEAHKAWQAKKHEFALQLANMQDDLRVAKTLRERYAPDKDWTNK